MEESTKGRLLVAAPTLLDPNFHRTVVLVVEHNDDGALGVILNRPSDTPVEEAVPPLAEIVGADDMVHVGGPVQPQGIVALAEFADPADAILISFAAIGLVPPEAEIDDLADRVLRARAYAGYAGWGPGQLEGELEREDWIVASPRPDDVFGEDTAELWPAVLTRMGGRFALVARMPEDPSVN